MFTSTEQIVETQVQNCVWKGYSVNGTFVFAVGCSRKCLPVVCRCFFFFLLECGKLSGVCVVFSVVGRSFVEEECDANLGSSSCPDVVLP